VIDLSKYQERFWEWQQENIGEVRDPAYLAMGMAEEVGEICHAMRCRERGVRGYDNDAKYLDEVADGIADTFVYSLQLASAHDLDVEKILLRTFKHVLSRDWTENALDGGGEKMDTMDTMDEESEPTHYVTDYDEGKGVFDR